MDRDGDVKGMEDVDQAELKARLPGRRHHPVQPLLGAACTHPHGCLTDHVTAEARNDPPHGKSLFVYYP